MSRRMTAVAILLAVVVGAVAIGGQSRRAEAHAALTRSSPESQAQLSTPPSIVDLWFSEPLEPGFSTFELFAADGTELPLADIRVDPADPFHLSGLPGPLDPGLYTVSYRSLSTRDGHEWTGTFAFTVLNPDGTVPSGAAFAPELGGRTSVARVAGRWLGFSGWSFVLGSVLVMLLAERGRPADPVVRRATSRVASGLTAASLPLLIVGAALELGAQTAALEAPALDVLSSTRFGTVWLWRALAVLTLLVTAALAGLAAERRRIRTRRWVQGTAAGSALGGLLTVSMLSHAAAAPGSAWAVLIDLAHLVLAAAWVGGLAALATVFARMARSAPNREKRTARTALLVGVVGPFSVFAAGAVFTLTATGVLRTFGEFPTLSAVWTTGYGRWLLVKLALILPLLGVAWMNRRTLKRALSGGRHAEEAVALRLRRMLPLEAALGVAVLAIVAVLGQVPTARGSAEAPTTTVARPYNRIEDTRDLNLHLQVSPATVGTNELRIHIYPKDGGPADDVERVFFIFAGAGLLGGERVDATPVGDGVYTASGSFLSLEQTWQVRVNVRRTEGSDLSLPFEVPIRAVPGTGAGSSAWSSPAPQLATLSLWGVVGLSLGAGLFLLGTATRGLAAPLQIGGATLAFVALWMVASGGSQADLGALPENPIAVSEESLAMGSALYSENCATCHGDDASGNGPLADTLSSPPADLRAHVPLHPAGETFNYISNSFPNSPMPAWKDRLSEEQIWHIVNYLREGLSG